MARHILIDSNTGCIWGDPADEQSALQAEAIADNLAGLLGVDRATAIRFAEIIRPHFERGESIEDAICSARAQVQRLAFRLLDKRDTPEFHEFAHSTCTAMYDDLRAA